MVENKLSSLADTEIFEALSRKNFSKAIEKLYECHFNEVIDHIVAKGGSEDDGADVFQESIITLIDLLKQEKFRQESSIRTYLFGIVTNKWLNDIRSKERRKKHAELYAVKELEKTETIEIVKKEDNLIVLLNKLEEPCKEILVGFYFGNKSMKVLLEEFDFKNEQVLRNRKSLCMKKLKELIQEDKTLLQKLKFEYQL